MMEKKRRAREDKYGGEVKGMREEEGMWEREMRD